MNNVVKCLIELVKVAWLVFMIGIAFTSYIYGMTFTAYALRDNNVWFVFDAVICIILGCACMVNFMSVALTIKD